MYEMTSLFWYRPIFMAELIVAEALFSSGLKRRKFFLLRALAAFAVCFGLSFAFPVAYNAIYCSFMFFVFFACTVLMQKLLFDDTWGNIIYCSMAAYTMQHMSYQLYDLVIVICGLNGGAPLDTYGNGLFFAGQNALTAVIGLFVYGLVYWLMYLLFASRLRKWDIMKLKTPSVMALAAVIVFIDIVFSAVVSYSSGDGFNRTHLIMLYVYNIVCCLLCFYMLFEMPLRKKLESEYETVNRLREKERQQYEMSKENINLINLKCHDLRHQIHQIGTRAAISGETMDEIEKIVSIYDSGVKTENNALDVILTEKSLLCNSAGIRFSCIVDGKSLGFMEETDLYSLFGNIVDNAIEAVSDPGVEEKLISLTVKRSDGLVSVNVHNYYCGKLDFENGLPLTTKKNKSYHGYGMKSIKRVVEKYGGELSVSGKGGIFNLNIVFPAENTM